MIEIKGAEERQGYFFAVSATEKSYLPLCLNGSEARPTQSRKVVRQAG
jgi:hypothetical protein